MSLKKVIALILMVLIGGALPAAASNRVQWYGDLQPPSSWLDQGEKNPYIGLGQLVYDLFGRSTAPAISNMLVSPAGGLYVQVGPASANTIASLYQVGVVDSTSFGGGPLLPSAALPADGTQIMHQGLLFSNGPALGPIASPPASNTVIDIVECQVQVVDTTQQTVNFVSQTNVASTGSVKRDRNDSIVCQIVQGAPATSSPATPATDTGWYKVATMTIPASTSTITSAMISQSPSFNGFLPAGAANAYVDTTTANQTVPVSKNFTAGLSVSGSAVAFAGSPSSYTTQGSSPYLSGDAQTNLGLIVNTASGSNGVQFMTAGALNGASIVNGALTATVGTLGVGANKVIIGGAPSGAIASLTSTSDGGLVESFLPATSTGETWQKYDGTTTTSLMRLSPSGTLTMSQAGPLITGLSSYGATGATVNGPIKGTTLTAGNCVQVDAGQNLVSAAGPCGVSSGSITSVVSTSPNLTASTASGTTTLGFLNTPTFGTASNAGAINFGTDGNHSLARSGDAFSLTAAGSAGAASLAVPGGVLVGSSTYNNTYASVAGAVTATGYSATSGSTTSTYNAASENVAGGSTALSYSIAATTSGGNLATDGSNLVIRGFKPGGSTLFQDSNGASWGSVNTSGFTYGSSVVGPNSVTSLTSSLSGGGDALTFTNATAADIAFPAAGIGPPILTNRSVGTKVVLYPQISSSNADYALGIENGALWNSIPGTSNAFKWYGGTTLAGSLSGNGNFSAVTSGTFGTGGSAVLIAGAGVNSTTPSVSNASDGGMNFGVAKASAYGYRWFNYDGTTLTQLATLTNAGRFVLGNDLSSTFQHSFGFGASQNGVIIGSGAFVDTDSGAVKALSVLGNVSASGYFKTGGSLIGSTSATIGGTVLSTNGIFAASGNAVLAPNNSTTNALVVSASQAVVNSTGQSGSASALSVPNGDIYTARGNNTGVIFLGNAGSHYLYFDGSNYQMPNGGLNLGGALTVGGALSTGNNSISVANASLFLNSNSNTSVLGAQIMGNNGQVVAGIGCTVLAVAQNGVAWRLCQDTAGNVGITGSYYAASARKLKDHIEKLSGPEAVALISSTDWSKFAYRTEHAKSWTHIGLIADDSPAAFAGPQHNHMDVNAVAAAAATAVEYQQNEIDHLQRRMSQLEQRAPRGEEHGWLYRLVHAW